MQNLLRKIPVFSIVVVMSLVNGLSVSAEEDKNTVPVLDFKSGISKQAEKPKFLKSWIQGDYATGDWLGTRAKLNEKGISINSQYFLDSFSKTHGGINESRPIKTLGFGNTSIELDTEKLGLWKGGTINTNVQYLRGSSLSNEFVGDYQGYNNNGADKYLYLNEYWVKQSLLKGKIEIKAGKQNANNDFCYLNSSGNFINSSFGLIPNAAVPTYPATALGIYTKITPVKLIDLRYGLFDGDARAGRSGFKTAFDKEGGLVNVAEINLNPEIKGHAGQYKTGFWLHSGDKEELPISEDEDYTPRTFGSNKGFYIAAEQNLYQEKKDPSQGLGILGQYGWSPQNRNEITNYYGVGLKYNGLIPKRDSDEIGIGLASVHFSNRSELMNNQKSESVIEIYNKIQLTPWFALQPDLQLVIHPNGNEKSTNVFGLRTIITF